MLRIMRGFLGINIRYNELSLISRGFCIRHVIIADLENYRPVEAINVKTFRLSFVKNLLCDLQFRVGIHKHTYTARRFHVPSLSPNNGK